MIALAEPCRFAHVAALAFDLDPTAIGAELLRARHMLGDAAVAAAEMLAFLMRVHRRDELEIERETGLVWL